MLEVKYIVTHTRLIKTETYICNLDGRFHRDRGISEKILEGSAGKFWLRIRSLKMVRKHKKHHLSFPSPPTVIVRHTTSQTV